MKSTPVLLVVIFSALSLINWIAPEAHWITEKHTGYTFLYTSADSENKTEYAQLIENGLRTIRTFFNASYNKPFDIYVHPNRHSLDSTWQTDWNMPDFKSECWMVASGVATRIDMISPKRWDHEACEHQYAQTEKTQQLITHELVHVYHGQRNTSPDFSNTEGIDWFVEGLATYASGQCDASRIAEIRKAVSDNKIPNGLDNFWSGKLKYGLSGSVVMYIDNTYGRAKLLELLPFSKKADLLAALKTTESELLDGWKKYMTKP